MPATSAKVVCAISLLLTRCLLRPKFPSMPPGPPPALRMLRDSRNNRSPKIINVGKMVIAICAKVLVATSARNGMDADSKSSMYFLYSDGMMVTYTGAGLSPKRSEKPLVFGTTSALMRSLMITTESFTNFFSLANKINCCHVSIGVPRLELPLITIHKRMASNPNVNQVTLWRRGLLG